MDRQALIGFGVELEKIAAQRRRLLAFADELEKIAHATGNEELLKQARIFRQAGRLMRDKIVPRAYVGATNLVHNPMVAAGGRTAEILAQSGGSVGKTALHAVEEGVHQLGHSKAVGKAGRAVQRGAGKLKKKLFPPAAPPGALASRRQAQTFAPVRA
jgi:hypothetical protein